MSNSDETSEKKCDTVQEMIRFVDNFVKRKEMEAKNPPPISPDTIVLDKLRIDLEEAKLMLQKARQKLQADTNEEQVKVKEVINKAALTMGKYGAIIGGDCTCTKEEKKMNEQPAAAISAITNVLPAATSTEDSIKEIENQAAAAIETAQPYIKNFHFAIIELENVETHEKYTIYSHLRNKQISSATFDISVQLSKFFYPEDYFIKNQDKENIVTPEDQYIRLATWRAEYIEKVKPFEEKLLQTKVNWNKSRHYYNFLRQAIPSGWLCSITPGTYFEPSKKLNTQQSMKRFYKTTIVLWSDYEPQYESNKKPEMIEVIQNILDVSDGVNYSGSCLGTVQTEEIINPTKTDPNCGDNAEFFSNDLELEDE